MYDSMLVGASSSSYAATAFSLAFMASATSAAPVLEGFQHRLPTDKVYSEQITPASYGSLGELEVVDNQKIDLELFEVSGEVFAKLSNHSDQLDNDVATAVYENFWDLCEA